MHVLCCAARVPRDEGEAYGKGVQKGLAQNDSGAQWGRRTGISRMEFGLAASRCIQIVFFPKITFVRYSISLRNGEAPGKMTRMVSSEYSQASYIAITGS